MSKRKLSKSTEPPVERDFVVPLRLLEEKKLEPLTHLLGEEVSVSTFDGFVVKGRVLPYTRVDDDFFGKYELMSVENGIGIKQVLTILGKRHVDVHLDCGSRHAREHKQALVRRLGAKLPRLSRLSGRPLRVVIVSPGRCVMPTPATDRAITIVVDGHAPGEVLDLIRDSICGIPIDKEGLNIGSLGIAAGRGIEVVDPDSEKGLVCGQVIGSTFYAFIPLCELSTSLAMAERMFERVCCQGLNVMADEASSDKNFITEEQDLYSQRRYLAFRKEFAFNLHEMLKKAVEDFEGELLAARKEVTSKALTLRRARNNLAAFEAVGVGKPRSKEWSRDYKMLKKLPDVDRVVLANAGIHVYTKEILMEHKGKVYNLGTYVIRCGPLGTLSIWSDRSTHPQRRMHPHEVNGTICLGNVDFEVTEAMVKGHYAKAVSLALAALKEGYDERDAMIPITEWPEEMTCGEKRS